MATKIPKTRYAYIERVEKKLGTVIKDLKEFQAELTYYRVELSKHERMASSEEFEKRPKIR